jgi:hypothetical protein
MRGYLATVNVPGYLPMDDDPPVFDSAQDAWQYLSDEYQRDGESAWTPDDEDDPDGPASLNETAVALEERARAGGEGTVYGPTPGYDGDHDLGLAYCVTWVDDPDWDVLEPDE